MLFLIESMLVGKVFLSCKAIPTAIPGGRRQDTSHKNGKNLQFLRVAPGMVLAQW